MRAGGGDIKTAQERRLMADQKRFKQKRDFKTRLGEEPEERELSGDRNFGKGKYAREDRRFGHKDGFQRGNRRDSGRDGRREGKPFGRDAENRRGKSGGDKYGKRDFDRKNNKSFNKFRRDDED